MRSFGIPPGVCVSVCSPVSGHQIGRRGCLRQIRPLAMNGKGIWYFLLKMINDSFSHTVGGDEVSSVNQTHGKILTTTTTTYLSSLSSLSSLLSLSGCRRCRCRCCRCRRCRCRCCRRRRRHRRGPSSPSHQPNSDIIQVPARSAQFFLAQS